MEDGAPATADEEGTPEPEKGRSCDLIAGFWRSSLLDDAELPAPPVNDGAEDLVPVPVGEGLAAGPVSAPDTMPSEGVGRHVAERLLVKLIKPSAESGSDAPAGSVPT